MQFRNITIEDKELFEEYLKNNEIYNESNYETNFETLFCFSKDLKIEIAVDDDAIYILDCEEGFTKFYPPIAKTEDAFRKAVVKLQNYAKNTGIAFAVEGITIKEKEIILADKTLYYHFSADRNNYEYLYKPQKFFHYNSSLQKYKVEQINAFEKRVPHELIDYKKDFYPAVEELFKEWLGNRKITEYDYNPMLTALKYYDELNLYASCLFTKGKLIGISIACTDRHNTGIVMFEKAEHKYFGSNAALVSYFALEKLKDRTFVNRQEDMGFEGLRISKLSYIADRFIQKFVMTAGFNY